ncbi:MAG TPA: SulP family inorganic anion transporter [Trueperaceae bacterium]|nr:SulP family inorganic anion transporter [Trueperaceae bacterium]
MTEGAGLEQTTIKSAAASRTQRGRLARDVTAGLVVAAVTITLSVSVGTLLTALAGPEYAARGIGLAVMSAFIAVSFVVARRAAASSIPSTQDAPAAVLAGTAVGLVADIGSGGQVAFATIMALSALTTVGTGIVFVTVGWLRLGRLVRFLPYPVMGGFLAGTGWLLLLGGLTVMAGSHVDLAHLGETVEPSWLYTVLPGLAFAVVLLVASRRLKHPAANPLLTIGGFLAFYLALLLSGSDLAAWRAEGLLIGEALGGSLLFGFRLSDLSAVDWTVLATQLPLAATIPFVALVATLLNVTSAELEERGPIDLDRELRVVGLGNLVAGGLGGMVAYHSVSLSSLSRRLGTGSRRTVYVVAAALLLTLVFGGRAVDYLPRPVIGGVVAFLGLEFLYQWLWHMRRRLGRVEYGIVFVILLVVVFSGFLQAVAVGLFLTVLLFVVSYGRIDPVRYAVTGAELRSRVRRGPEEEAALQASAGSTLVLQLQGFLFFGTTVKVAERVEASLGSGGFQRLVLDLSRVTGFDASGTSSLKNLAKRAGAAGATIALAGVTSSLENRLRTGGVLTETEDVVEVYPTVDAALEAQEARLLTEAGVTPASDRPTSLAEMLAGSTVDVKKLESYLERIELDEGAVLIEQGTEADALYLVTSGRVTAERTRPGLQPERFETMGTGSVVGELGLATGKPRAATVRADTATVVHKLSRSALRRLEREDPATAAALYGWLTRHMSGRIAHLMTTVDALRR